MSTIVKHAVYVNGENTELDHCHEEYLVAGQPCTCVECQARIPPGWKYRCVTGKLEGQGSFVSFNMCESCARAWRTLIFYRGLNERWEQIGQLRSVIMGLCEAGKFDPDNQLVKYWHPPACRPADARGQRRLEFSA